MKKSNIGQIAKMILFFLAGILSMTSGCAGEREAESLFWLVAEEIDTDGTADCNSAYENVPATNDLAQEEKTVFVHICGEVMHPGVYEVPADSRIYDVLMRAGGFSDEASEDYLNLAALVSDGMQIRILSEEEADAEKKHRLNEALGLVNINTASVEELCTLPGIGESRAEDIIAYRTVNGAFEAKEEIMQVSGIKDSMYQKLEDKICID